MSLGLECLNSMKRWSVLNWYFYLPSFVNFALEDYVKEIREKQTCLRMFYTDFWNVVTDQVFVTLNSEAVHKQNFILCMNNLLVIFVTGKHVVQE